MSEENVELVRQEIELFNQGKPASEAIDVDVDVIPPEGWPEGMPVKGREGWDRQLDRLRDSWEDARAEVDDIRVAGPGQVVARFRYVTTGKDSGIEFDMPMGGVYAIEDGRIVRMQFFNDPKDAYEAAGVSSD
jgi:ketosteroid isomerase-like protein